MVKSSVFSMDPTFICLFAEMMPPAPCDLLSCFEISQAAFSPPNLPNLENIGFYSFKSVFSATEFFLSLC